MSAASFDKGPKRMSLSDKGRLSLTGQGLGTQKSRKKTMERTVQSWAEMNMEPASEPEPPLKTEFHPIPDRRPKYVCRALLDELHTINQRVSLRIDEWKHIGRSVSRRASLLDSKKEGEGTFLLTKRNMPAVRKSRTAYYYLLITHVPDENTRVRLGHLWTKYNESGAILSSFDKCASIDQSMEEVLQWLQTDSERLKNDIREHLVEATYADIRYIEVYEQTMKTLVKLRAAIEEIGPYKAYVKYLKQVTKSVSTVRLITSTMLESNDPMELRVKSPSSSCDSLKYSSSVGDMSSFGRMVIELAGLLGQATGTQEFDEAQVKTIDNTLATVERRLELDEKKIVGAKRTLRKDEMNMKSLRNRLNTYRKETASLQMNLKDLAACSSPPPGYLTPPTSSGALTPSDRRHSEVKFVSKGIQTEWFVWAEDEEVSRQASSGLIQSDGEKEPARMSVVEPEKAQRVSVVMPETMVKKQSDAQERSPTPKEDPSLTKVRNLSERAQKLSQAMSGLVKKHSRQVSPPMSMGDKQEEGEKKREGGEEGEAKENGEKEENKMKRKKGKSEEKRELTWKELANQSAEDRDAAEPVLEGKELEKWCAQSHQQLRECLWDYMINMQTHLDSLLNEFLSLRVESKEDQKSTDTLDQVLKKLTNKMIGGMTTARKPETASTDEVLKVQTRLRGNHECSFCLCHDVPTLIKTLSMPESEKDANDTSGHCGSYMLVLGTCEPTYTRTFTSVYGIDECAKQLEWVFENVDFDYKTYEELDMQNAGQKDEELEIVVDSLWSLPTETSMVIDQAGQATLMSARFTQEIIKLLDTSRHRTTGTTRKENMLHRLQQIQQWTKELTSEDDLNTITDPNHALLTEDMLQGSVCPYCNCFILPLQAAHDIKDDTPLDPELSERNVKAEGFTMLSNTLQTLDHTIHEMVDREEDKIDSKAQEILTDVLGSIKASILSVVDQQKHIRKQWQTAKAMFVLDEQSWQGFVEEPKQRASVFKTTGTGQVTLSISAMGQMLVDPEYRERVQAEFIRASHEKERAPRTKEMSPLLTPMSSTESEPKPSSKRKLMSSFVGKHRQVRKVSDKLKKKLEYRKSKSPQRSTESMCSSDEEEDTQKTKDGRKRSAKSKKRLETQTSRTRQISTESIGSRTEEGETEKPKDGRKVSVKSKKRLEAQTSRTRQISTESIGSRTEEGETEKNKDGRKVSAKSKDARRASATSTKTLEDQKTRTPRISRESIGFQIEKDEKEKLKDGEVPEKYVRSKKQSKAFGEDHLKELERRKRARGREVRLNIEKGKKRGKRPSRTSGTSDQLAAKAKKAGELTRESFESSVSEESWDEEQRVYIDMGKSEEHEGFTDIGEDHKFYSDRITGGSREPTMSLDISSPSYSETEGSSECDKSSVAGVSKSRKAKAGIKYLPKDDKKAKQTVADEALCLKKKIYRMREREKTKKLEQTQKARAEERILQSRKPKDERGKPQQADEELILQAGRQKVKREVKVEDVLEQPDFGEYSEESFIFEPREEYTSQHGYSQGIIEDVGLIRKAWTSLTDLVTGREEIDRSSMVLESTKTTPETSTEVSTPAQTLTIESGSRPPHFLRGAPKTARRGTKLSLTGLAEALQVVTAVEAKATESDKSIKARPETKEKPVVSKLRRGTQPCLRHESFKAPLLIRQYRGGKTASIEKMSIEKVKKKSSDKEIARPMSSSSLPSVCNLDDFQLSDLLWSKSEQPTVPSESLQEIRKPEQLKTAQLGKEEEEESYQTPVPAEPEPPAAHLLTPELEVPVSTPAKAEPSSSSEQLPSQDLFVVSGEYIKGFGKAAELFKTPLSTKFTLLRRGTLLPQEKPYVAGPRRPTLLPQEESIAGLSSSHVLIATIPKPSVSETGEVHPPSESVTAVSASPIVAISGEYQMAKIKRKRTVSKILQSKLSELRKMQTPEDLACKGEIVRGSSFQTSVSLSQVRKSAPAQTLPESHLEMLRDEMKKAKPMDKVMVESVPRIPAPLTRVSKHKVTTLHWAKDSKVFVKPCECFMRDAQPKPEQLLPTEIAVPWYLVPPSYGRFGGGFVSYFPFKPALSTALKLQSLVEGTLDQPVPLVGQNVPDSVVIQGIGPKSQKATSSNENTYNESKQAQSRLGVAHKKTLPTIAGGYTRTKDEDKYSLHLQGAKFRFRALRTKTRPKFQKKKMYHKRPAAHVAPSFLPMTTQTTGLPHCGAILHFRYPHYRGAGDKPYVEQVKEQWTLHEMLRVTSSSGFAKTLKQERTTPQWMDRREWMAVKAAERAHVRDQDAVQGFCTRSFDTWTERFQATKSKYETKWKSAALRERKPPGLKTPCYYLGSPYHQHRFFVGDKRSLITLDVRAPPKDDYVDPMTARKPMTPQTLRKYPLGIYPSEAELASYERILSPQLRREPHPPPPHASRQQRQRRRNAPPQPPPPPPRSLSQPQQRTGLAPAASPSPSPRAVGPLRLTSPPRLTAERSHSATDRFASSHSSRMLVVQRYDMVLHIKRGQQRMIEREQTRPRRLVAEILDFEIPGMKGGQTYTELLHTPPADSSDSLESTLSTILPE